MADRKASHLLFLNQLSILPRHSDLAGTCFNRQIGKIEIVTDGLEFSALHFRCTLCTPDKQWAGFLQCEADLRLRCRLHIDGSRWQILIATTDHSPALNLRIEEEQFRAEVRHLRRETITKLNDFCFKPPAGRAF